MNKSRSIRATFETTVNSMRMLLADEACDTPRKLRKAMAEVVGAYSAMSAVKNAHEHMQESGVAQWRTFLRAANVKTGEAIDAYRSRVEGNLREMERFAGRYLRP
jgi:hypothetical protein